MYVLVTLFVISTCFLKLVVVVIIVQKQVFLSISILCCVLENLRHLRTLRILSRSAGSKVQPNRVSFLLFF